jgi:hypothetical protein
MVYGADMTGHCVSRVELVRSAAPEALDGMSVVVRWCQGQSIQQGVLQCSSQAGYAVSVA